MCENNNENVNYCTFTEISNFSRKSTGDEVVKRESNCCLRWWFQVHMTEPRIVGNVRNVFGNDQFPSKNSDTLGMLMSRPRLEKKLAALRDGVKGSQSLSSRI